MTLDQGLRAHLTGPTGPAGSALAEVQEALGGLTGTVRVYPVQIPQRRTPLWPVLTVQRIGDGRRVWSHGGPSGLVETRLQLDAWARTTDSMFGDEAVATLADALRRALDGFTGAWSGVVVRKSQLTSEREAYDADTVARLWRRSQDYLVWHEEAA